MKLLLSMFLVTILMVMFTGQMFSKYEDDVDLDNIYNNTFVWKEIEPSSTNGDFYLKGILEIIYDFANFFGKVLMKLSSLGFRFGFENPQYNYNFFMQTIIVVMFLPFVIPIVAILYLVIGGIINLYKKLRR